MAIGWDGSLEIGVPTIDRQHRELFERLDALLEAAHARRSAEEVGRCLGFLSEYVETHFGDEERIMREGGYPRAPEHLAEHARFRADLDALLREFLADGATALLVVKVNARVATWLREHISRTDRVLGAWLADPFTPGGGRIA